MGERAAGRREVLRGAGVAAGGVVATVGPAAPAHHGTGGAAGDASRLTGGGPTGSWLVTRQDDEPGGDRADVRAVFSFAGGDVFVEHDVAPQGPPLTGTWERRSAGRFRATVWSGWSGGGHPDGHGSGPGRGHLDGHLDGHLNGHGSAGPAVRVQLTGHLRHGRLSGTYAFTVFDPATGTATRSGTGTFHGHRIEA